MTIDIKQRILEVLQAGHLMSLGTVDEQGVWVADLIYIFDDLLNLYWMSSPKTRHSAAVELNGKAACSITLSTNSKEDNLGIQCEGVATKLASLDFDIAKKHLMKRNLPVPAVSVDVLRPGASWYMLKLARIYLIDEKNFGFNRQKFELI